MNESIVVDVLLWAAGLLFYLMLMAWVIHDSRSWITNVKCKDISNTVNLGDGVMCYQQ